MEYREEDILDFWKRERIFEKSVDARRGRKRFVFFEGPPTANGMPHVGHALTRAMKDVILRYKTLRGYFVDRRAGWDTQGLPVEIEVEKALGFKAKKDIEEYGIAEFNAQCKASVWKYRDEWVRFSDRMGFWVDFDRAYVTYDNHYIETLWWILKRTWEQGYLYEDHKIVPWCARCGTGLSSHELAQGYATVKDVAVTVAFLVPSGTRIGDFTATDRTYVLAWTTTPWTLPGNTALAVGDEVSYVAARLPDDRVVIIAEARAASILPVGFTVLATWNGKVLEGVRYQPLMSVSGLQTEQAYHIYMGDFISTSEGTGIVHIAPMYGEDDYALGRRANLPLIHTVDEAGRFLPNVGPSLAGRAAKDSSTERDILGMLKKENAVFTEDVVEHEYPFCWRCKSPVLYYAQKAWWIRMSALRDELMKRNATVTWFPEHLKAGRFGEWISEVKDWAFSRARYWGTPLPIWRCGNCGGIHVVGSIDELLRRATPLKNRYVIFRHGEAESNVKGIVATDIATDVAGLTERGKHDVIVSCQKLEREGVRPDLVIVSPFQRTRESAALMKSFFGVADERLLREDRIREVGLGAMNGEPVSVYRETFPLVRERFLRAPEGGETFTMVRQRMLEVIREMEESYRDKTIFIVSHGDPLFMLKTGLHGIGPNELPMSEQRFEGYPRTGQAEILSGAFAPLDADGFLDLHRPFIDAVRITCPSCGGVMERVKELADVWFDSGAMPFAQWHYPFDEKKRIDRGALYPADYITEAIDQTRGWFYTLLAVSALLGKPAPYRQVISIGHMLDKNGKKMSKSLGNVVGAMDAIETHGADAFRWYAFVASQPWDEKRFNDVDILTRRRNFLDILWNTFAFWRLYRDVPPTVSSRHILDEWIEVRLRATRETVTKELDRYHVTEAARALEAFVADDLSRWYIRRSRERIKREGADTLRRVLSEVSILAAPFVPFIAEEMYRELEKSHVSVHCTDWPRASRIARWIPWRASRDALMQKRMELVREISGLGLEARARSNMKIRQPLSALIVRDARIVDLPSEFLALVRDELNVKDIRHDPGLADAVALDTVMTDELILEGKKREKVRSIAEMRKAQRLKPGDLIRLRIGPSALKIFTKDIEADTTSTIIEWVEGDVVEIVP